MAEGHVDMLANVENAVWHAFDFLGKNICFLNEIT
jgi:hypothetical protein